MRGKRGDNLPIAIEIYECNSMSEPRTEAITLNELNLRNQDLILLLIHQIQHDKT